MSGMVAGLGKVFQTVGKTVSNVTKSVVGVGKSAFTAITANGAPALSQGGGAAVTGSTGALGNTITNVMNQAGYGDGLGYSASAATVAAPQSTGFAAAAVPKSTGFGAMLQSPMAANVLQGLGAGVDGMIDRRHAKDMQTQTLDQQQRQIDDVRNSYKVNPNVYDSPPEQKTRVSFDYNPASGRIERA